MTVGYLPQDDDYAPAFMEAWKELGIREIDFNNGNTVGIGKAQFHSIHGSRMSSNGAFIRPIRGKRKNLFIKTNAKVTRIIIDEKTKTAIGVEYEVSNDENTSIMQAFATKEVIVSAGVIDSPKLLMLSGIGPAEHLQSLNITVVQDLPVGQNLHNQIQASSINFEVDTNISSIPPENMWNDLVCWMSSGEGLMSTHGTLSVNVGYQTKYERRRGVADIQLFPGSNESKNASTHISGPYHSGTRVITVYSVLLDPRSRGYLKLNPVDPSGGKPEICMNYLTNPRDMNVLVEGLKFARKLGNTRAVKKWGLKLSKKPEVGCEIYNFESEGYLKCLIRKHLLPLNHYVGSCKMGPKTDCTSVVDAELKVHAVNGLRVVDASIMPQITKGNTYAPVVMIGEKGSDMIKSSWL